MSAGPAPSLEQLLKDNPFLRDIHEKLQADPFASILPRLAIARSFNAPLYEQAIRGDSPLTFAQLIARPEVRPVPERPGDYWLNSACLESGRAQRDDERPAQALAILRVLEQTPATPVLERLTVLAFADPPGALRAWRKAFDDASAANDFAACYTIVQAIDGLLGYLPEEPLGAALRELRARYRARALYLREWHRTAAYYPRHGARRTLDRVLDSKDGGKWIFQLFAPGGMGKTMFLEAQIARRLVVGADRALVARLDLDFLAVNNLMKAPWLLAIEMGRQWDLQLPLPAFERLLSGLQAYAPLLYSPQSDRYQAPMSAHHRRCAVPRGGPLRPRFPFQTGTPGRGHHL